MRQLEPDRFEWFAQIWIPLFAGFASVAVASVSAVIAAKAWATARDSEKARVTAEAARDKVEQQRRLDAAIRDLFVGIAGLMDANIAASEEDKVRLKQWVDDPKQGRRWVENPSSSSVQALIAAALLEAPEKGEQDMLERVHEYVLKSDKLSYLERNRSLTNVWTFVVNWRHADATGRQELLATRS